MRLSSWSRSFLATAVLATVTPIGRAQTNLTSGASNPILSGTSGAWDENLVMTPSIVLHGGTYYLYYSGRLNSGHATNGSIGLATSSDGVNYAKHPNPILSGDGTGFDAITAFGPNVLVENGMWVMYYGGRDDMIFGPTEALGRATASGPFGPWTSQERPVLEVGSTGEWDSELISPGPVIKMPGGTYRMFYTGITNWPSGQIGIGLATSNDGITWAKYDDPSTTTAPFQFSDPVLSWGEAGSWDELRTAWPAVATDGTRWDMYYTGAKGGLGLVQDLGYATSLDGIRWVRYRENPILRARDQNWTSSGIVGSTVLRNGPSPYTVYFAATANLTTFKIGMATGPETEDLFLGTNADCAPVSGRVCFETWQGKPGNPAFLFLTAVNGVPFVLFLQSGVFDASGTWLPPCPTNPGLGGIPLTFQTFAPGRFSGAVQTTNEQTVVFK